VINSRHMLWLIFFKIKRRITDRPSASKQTKGNPNLSEIHVAQQLSSPQEKYVHLRKAVCLAFAFFVLCNEEQKYIDEEERARISDESINDAYAKLLKTPHQIQSSN